MSLSQVTHIYNSTYNQNFWFKIVYANFIKTLAQIFMFCLVKNYFFLFFLQNCMVFLKILCYNHILMQIERILDKQKIISLFFNNSNYSLRIGGHNTTCTNCNYVVYQYKPLHYNASV